jgi:prophage tail gpP-like protein
MNIKLKYDFVILIACVLTLFTGCNKEKNDSDSCNGTSTRREIKILIDDLVSEIYTNTIITTVDLFGSLVVTEASSDSKRQNLEKKVYTITAEVHKLSKHRDGDWKI